MAEFIYTNTKNTSTRYTLFKLNCGYYLYILYKKNVSPCCKFKVADKLTKKLRNLIAVCRENLQYAQEVQKQALNKKIKLRSYTPSKKIWFNNKYIKTKYNQKLEAKFFGLFQVL